MRSALEHEKTPELAERLAQESLTQDEWARELSQLRLPKLVQQLALNAFREPAPEGSVLLHLRSAQRHLNSASAQQMLAQALSGHYGHPVALSIVEDDDPQRRTPLEGARLSMKRVWRRPAHRLQRMAISRPCGVCSMPSWMKRASAPFNRCAAAARPYEKRERYVW